MPLDAVRSEHERAGQPCAQGFGLKVRKQLTLGEPADECAAVVVAGLLAKFARCGSKLLGRNQIAMQNLPKPCLVQVFWNDDDGASTAALDDVDCWEKKT